MEAVLIAINKVLDIKVVQWGMLVTLVSVIPYLSVKVYWYKYDNALLKSTVGDVSQALFVQNRAVKELGAKADELKANYEQANKRATQVALEGQRTLQDLMKNKLVGTCEEKVAQVGRLAREALK